MNKAFKKTKKIVLDSSYDITPDSGSGVVLTFTETRMKETIIKQNNKKIHTGLFEPFLFTEKLYFPRIAQALRHYCNATLNNNDSIIEVISKAEKVYEIIEKIDKEFKQF